MVCGFRRFDGRSFGENVGTSSVSVGERQEPAAVKRAAVLVSLAPWTREERIGLLDVLLITRTAFCDGSFEHCDARHFE